MFDDRYMGLVTTGSPELFTNIASKKNVGIGLTRRRNVKCSATFLKIRKKYITVTNSTRMRKKSRLVQHIMALPFPAQNLQKSLDRKREQRLRKQKENLVDKL